LVLDEDRIVRQGWVVRSTCRRRSKHDCT
jgi:hypothetical protein